MSTQYVEYPAIPAARNFSWSGIFAGTFLFLAIEVTFGVLGDAIFGSGMNLQMHNSVGMGLGIWMVILSIIALYFAGKLASKLSGAATRNTGMYAGLVTFGMCIFSSILIAAMALSSTVAGTGVASAAPARMADFMIHGGYWLFAALILAGISAASGGIHGAWNSEKRQPPIERTTTTTTTEPRRVA